MSAGYLRVDPQGAVEILVEQALPAKEVDRDAARKDLAAAEAELAKWGEQSLDEEAITSRCRTGSAGRARIDAVPTE